MLKKWLYVSGTAFAQFDNSPARTIVIPEVIWAPATGGGTWLTQVQITSLSYNTNISVDFVYGGAAHRQILNMYTDLDYLRSVTLWNILENMGSVDTGFTYYGKVGALVITTQDSDHLIQAQARTVNGNFGKTLQGLSVVQSNVAITGRDMMIQNMASNATYRTFVGFLNFSLGSITVDFRLYDGNGNTVGNYFTKTFISYDFQSFNPFVEAGASYPSYSNANIVLVITPTAGGLSNMGLMGFGSSANNLTNDTYAHAMVQRPASNN
jgi:hypothetical protein